MLETSAELFALDPGLVYLNHAAVAPWPVATADAVADFARENVRTGAERYPDWMAVESSLRRKLADLINAPSTEDIALVKNTSEALSLVAYGLDWTPGDEIVGIAGDFPSNRVTWESLATRGVRFVGVDTLNAEDPESALLSAFTDKTRLLAVSSVHYASGRRLDLDRLGQSCRTQDVLFCIDAIQSVGAIPFDVRRHQADFVAADGHKWLLGPEGLGFFYCRAELREKLSLKQYGWHMLEEVGNYTAADWRPAASARRFEPGSPNMLAIHALEASTEVIAGMGVEHIFTQILRLNNYLIEKAGEYGLSPRYSMDLPSQGSGIVTLDPRGAGADTAWRKLMETRIVTAPRGGGIRFSPHIHNTEAQIDFALASLDRVISEAGL